MNRSLFKGVFPNIDKLEVETQNVQTQVAAMQDNKEAVLLLLEHGFVPFSRNTLSKSAIRILVLAFYRDNICGIFYMYTPILHVG